MNKSEQWCFLYLFVEKKILMDVYGAVTVTNCSSRELASTLMKICNCKSGDVRRRGKPRIQWEDQIMKNIKSM